MSIDPIAEAEAISDFRAGDILAGGRLVKMHAGLIHSVARRHVTPRCELDDLLQVCRMALLDIVPEHDPGRARLSTFAFKRLHRMASRYARSGRYVVKVTDGGRRDGANPLPVWLDAPIDGGDETIASRLMVATEEPASTVDAEILVASLPTLERCVLERLYLGDGSTLKEVAASYGVSPQRIGRIKLEAIAMLRERAAA